MRFIARAISQHAVKKTNIEIHPGATIGKRFFIDHGTGVVIGETAEIGDDVTIYQGVTLGGTGKDTGKRHPTIGNGVMIGSGAKVLGPFKVGDNSNIASGAVVLDEIPPNSTAVGVPARVVKQNGKRVDDLDQIHIPDPIAMELCKMQIQIDKLNKKIQSLEEEKK
jgi:serine O-acetyltransferase